MSPDYHEVRLALLAQVMDESRHLDVFRKRALANGGGLMRMIDTVSDVAAAAPTTPANSPSFRPACTSPVKGTS